MLLTRLWLVLVALPFLLLACAPQAAPAPAPSPAVAPVAPAAALSPGDAALQKLIEVAKKEGSVTLYSYNFVADTGLAMQRAFQERYGVKVDIITGRGSEFTERLRTEARSGNRVADWTEGSPVHLNNMKKVGLTVSVSDLPVLQEKGVWKKDPAFLDPEGHLLAAYPMFMQPFINTKLVKPEEEPKSWFDLLQPKWKGKVLFNDPVVSSSAYLIFQPLIKGGALTEDYLEKLGAQDMVFVTGAPQGIEWLSRGQAPIFVGTQAAIASAAVQAGAPVKVIDFKEGMAGQAIVQAVIKDAPRPNAAKLFTNWWLSKEGQSVYAKAKGAPSVRNDVPPALPPALDVDPVKVFYATAQDIEIQGTMFRDKVWVAALKKK